jgi:hypothetical protein
VDGSLGMNVMLKLKEMENHILVSALQQGEQNVVQLETLNFEWFNLAF